MTKLKDIVARFDLFQWSALLFSASFSFGIAANSIAYALFLLLGTAITISDFWHKKGSFDLKTANLILAAFFAIIFIRELQVDWNESLGIITNYLPFLAIPVIISFQAKKLKKITPVILKVFLVGCLINVSINLSYAVYRGIIENEQGINFWYFTYEFLSEPFGIQPIYLGLFYVFGILILNHFKSETINPYFYNATILILTLGIFLLSARIAILCLILLVPLQLLLIKKLSVRNILILLSIFGIAFLFAIQNPVVKNRIFKVTKAGNFYSGTSLRSAIWESAYEVSKENFVWGLGEKKADSLMVEAYKDKELKVPMQQRYHTHNQYLQTLVQYGFIGMLVLLGALFWPIIKVLRKSDYLGFLWLLLFSMSAVTESVFTRQWGILGFAFFTSLLLLNGSKLEKKK